MTDEIKEKKNNDSFSLKDTIEIIVIFVALFVVLQLLFQSSIVKSISMQPTYYEGNRLLVSKVAYTFSEPQRGDVIALNPPVEGRENERFIKRIIGLPGEQVDVMFGKVTITTASGEQYVLEEDYIKAKPTYQYHSGVIPEGCYVVLGDNRNESFDSHYGWVVPEENIIGKAWIDLWPFSRLGLSKNHKFDF